MARNLSSLHVFINRQGKAMDDSKRLYEDLLDQDTCEQNYQSFLEKNTKFIPRNFTQNHGIHFDLLLRKLKISNQMITDFAFLTKSSTDWSIVLIEIEKPGSRFFKAGTKDLHGDFKTGVEQIKAWQAWFADPKNKLHFEEQLRFLKKPLPDNPMEIKYILVTGRRSEYEGDQTKIQKIRSFEDDCFKIMSFDSLKEDVNNKNELHVGIKKHDHIDIISNTLISTNFLEWCDESDFRLSRSIKDAAISHINQKISAYEKSNGSLRKIGAERMKKLLTKVNNIQTCLT